MSQNRRNFFLFLVFLAANTVLSYFPFSLEAKLWIGLLGLLVPGVLWLGTGKAKSWEEKPKDQSEFLPPIPAWMWILIGILALVVRFSQLTTLSVWPHYDEGVYGYYALQLNEKWDWRLFYGDSRVPPLYIWLLSLIFRVFGTSLFSLWLLPALVSILVVPTAYWAATRFFSKSFSFLFALLMAFSFWPWLLGRFSFMTGLVLLAECLAFYFLGNFLHPSSPSTQKKWALALGFLLGFGFLIHIHWMIIAGVLAATLLYGLKSSGKVSQQAFFFWAFPFFLLFLPFFYLCATQGYGSYLRHLAIFHQSSSWIQQAAVSISYPCALFWGMDTHFHTYQPLWGGFLNPVLGSLFFLGFLETWKNRQLALNRWLLWAFFIFLLPGLLTSDRETFRMVPVIPVMLVITALGWQKLCASFPNRKGMVLSLFLFLPAMGLDSYHLFGVYHHLWDTSDIWRGYTKSVERFRAYELLKQIASEKGPGLLFDDFIPGLPDQTLTVAAHDFNAAENPDLSFEKAQWAAVLTNVNYQPFLAKRFPDGRYAWLSKDLSSSDGGLMLWVIPLDSSRIKELKNWQEASLALHPFIDETISYFPDRTYQESLKTLFDAKPAFNSDSFLRSCFWEKAADIYFKESVLTPGSSDRQAVQALEKATQEGYPAAHLYEHLGIFDAMAGNKKEAEEAFQKALKAPFNHTDAETFLQKPRTTAN